MKKAVFWVFMAAFATVGGCAGGLMIWTAISTGDSAAAADAFLIAIAQERYQDAYAAASSEFRAAQNEEAFINVASRVDLSQYTLDRWRDRRLESSGKTKIEGKINQAPWFEGGTQTIKFVVDMVDEDGEWKVLSFTGPWRSPPNFFELGPGTWFRQTPTDSQLIDATREVLLGFDQAVKVGDFTEFYDSLSFAFRSDRPVSMLQDAYQHFIDKEIDLSGVSGVDPVFIEATKLDRSRLTDIMVVRGFYPIEPQPVPFVIRFIYEHPDLKVFRIGVDEPTIENLSPEDCLQFLLREGSTEGMKLDRCFDKDQEFGKEQ